MAAELAARAAANRLTSYQPYPKQLEFHDAGREHRERLLMAGNQLGKTLSAGMELAMHVTGRYPAWWTGYRFDRPTRWMVGSESIELTKKGVQRILLGNPETPEQWGTGAIPKDALIATSPRPGSPNAVSSIVVRHVSGGESVITTASYDQGRTKWQADTLDGVWFDEEPPEDVYMEGITRTNVSQGPVFITFTPLQGATSVVRRFWPRANAFPNTYVVQMTIDDVEHYSDEQRAIIVASYPEHERKARLRGIPALGSGRVFGVDRDDITCKPIVIPDSWVQIGGLDFGWDHPSAAARLAWDRDNDRIYVTATHRAREQTPTMFAAAVRPWGLAPDGNQWLPWAWPHDGLQHDKGSGEQLAAQYRAQGLKLLPQRATFEDGSNGLEAGVSEMHDRMLTGRWVVFETCHEWLDEFEGYHRKEGLIVKEHDDLLSASRYAMMMRRYAELRVRPAPARNASMAGFGRSQGWMG